MKTKITLFDCYTKKTGLAYMTGMQALVRLLLEQKQLDSERGLKTCGLVSGYPGSPLGGFDIELNRHQDLLVKNQITFQPAINEELAATAIWGSQHIHLYDNPNIDGVFGLWYGKGPGLDRSLDALRHVNMGGVSPYGGMVLAIGDDPTGKSSTIAYQSEQTLIAAGIPFFFPRSIHDIIPLGLKAFALSRFSGCCVGLKIVVDTADASAVVNLDKIRPKILSPEPIKSVHIRKHDPALERENLLFNVRLPAAESFQKKNQINVFTKPSQKFCKVGIVGVGKSILEINDTLRSLGIKNPSHRGIGLFSVIMPFPIEKTTIIEFIKDFDEIFVIEEKRPIVEEQISRTIVNIPDRPIITGKLAPDGTKLLPATGEITHSELLLALSKRLSAHSIPTNPVSQSVFRKLTSLPTISNRTPWYCAGCPHNSSTKLPDGEIAGMGIGCHSISGFLTPEEITNFTQMGGEGAFWIGRAPFSNREHSFQNIGDGTYSHSGYLAVRAAIAAGVNITFKILYNGVVAMTGGQDIEGGQPPWMISQQLSAEGVIKTAVISDDPNRFPPSADWAKNSKIYHRSSLMQVQEDLRKTKGVTAIIYVQACATELRRKRKRNAANEPRETIIINQAVCEGCGDCASHSNCVAVKPILEPDGEKKIIDQSLCNKDMSCLNGFCPSFVSITSKSNSENKNNLGLSFPPDTNLPQPTSRNTPISNIFIAGIGGTGVSTLSGVMIMAARIDGLDGTAVNQTGLSQKNGGVTSQIRLAKMGKLKGYMVRLPVGEANVLLALDSVVASNDMALSFYNKSETLALLNSRIDPVGVAGVGIGTIVDSERIMSRLSNFIDPKLIHSIDFSEIAESLFNSTTYSNILMLGWVVQNGWIPLTIESVENAIRLNGNFIDKNLLAFRWGRLLAHDPEKVLQLTNKFPIEKKNFQTFENVTAAQSYFSEKLKLYENEAYAKKFDNVINHFKTQSSIQKKYIDRLGIKAARALYRAMAIKDEYEVARLLTHPSFKELIFRSFGKDIDITYNLAPPFLTWFKSRDQIPQKWRFGNWFEPVLRQLANLSWLRGRWFDPFGYSRERKLEHEHRDQVISWILELSKAREEKKVDAILDLILSIRGYGHVKEKNLRLFKPQIVALIAEISHENKEQKISLNSLQIFS